MSVEIIEDLVFVIQRLERKGADLTAYDINIARKAKQYLGYSVPESIEEGTGALIHSRSLDKKLKETINGWEDWKKQAYNEQFAISKYSEKLDIGDKL